MARDVEEREVIIASEIAAKLVLNWEQNMLYAKRWHVFCRKKISMSAGLKMSSLACNCVFKRPEHNAKGCPMQLNFEGLDMQKWNIGMIRAQRIFWSLKCQKWLFFVFSSDDSKNLVAVWTKHVSASERSYLNHSENAMDYEVLNYH